jgi:hypothetical protein
MGMTGFNNPKLKGNDANFKEGRHGSIRFLAHKEHRGRT